MENLLTGKIYHDHHIRVRYGETDQMGMIYYGNYAEYYEIGRVETMRTVGISYAQLEEKYNIWMPVLSMHSRFIRPGRYDNKLIIRTHLKKLTKRSITFYTEIINIEDKIINAATVILYFLDNKIGRRIDTPTPMINFINEYIKKIQ